MSDTPRTDEVASHEGSWDTKALRMTHYARYIERELDKAQNILKQCLSIMPVGYVPTHTVENLPEMIGDLAKALAEETTEREQLERELAEARKENKKLIADMILHERMSSQFQDERDTLAEALGYLMQSCESIDCEAMMPASMPDAYGKAKQALAAVKGGSDE